MFFDVVFCFDVDCCWLFCCFLLVVVVVVFEVICWVVEGDVVNVGDVGFVYGVGLVEVFVEVCCRKGGVGEYCV